MRTNKEHLSVVRIQQTASWRRQPLLSDKARGTESGMISVVIPTFNSADTLVATLNSLIPATVSGSIREVIVADGGSDDLTRAIAEDAGAIWVACGHASRGAQLRAGADAARSAWLLFLHADTELEPGWDLEARALIQDGERDRSKTKAGVFTFQLDDQGAVPRIVENVVSLRTRFLKLPYGDQGLLISRELYDSVGGYKPLALMEDVDLVRRVGGRRLQAFKSKAKTSAARYRRHGYLRRIARNQTCLALYYMNVSPAKLAKVYQAEPSGKIRPT